MSLQAPKQMTIWPGSCTAMDGNDDRGLHIVVINPENYKVEQSKVFDTYASSEGFDEFISEMIPDSYIIVAACKDDCVKSLSQAGR